VDDRRTGLTSSRPWCGTHEVAGRVKGQEFLPTGGHEFCPLVAIRSAR